MVNAFRSPPTDSISAEIVMASRDSVPLNSKCSRKWAEPIWDAGSSREPAATHTPRATERTPGTYSVMTRRPPGRVVRLTTPPSAPRISVAVWARLGNDHASVDSPLFSSTGARDNLPR